MRNRILSYLAIGVLSVTVMISCDNAEDVIAGFNSIVDVSDSAIADSKYTVTTVFSTDGGTTFKDYPDVKKGDTYMVKVVDGDFEVNAENCLAVDWSTSDPAPTGAATGDTAEFVMGENNSIKAVVTSLYTPYSAASWAGAWGGDEVGACCGGTDANNLRQDTANPNKYIMDNFWGDHVDAYIIFTPSTNLTNQIVDLPQQTTSEGGVASGTGTYDQCTQTFTIATTYKIGGGTYVFAYNFHR